MSVIAAAVVIRSYGRQAMADCITQRHLGPYWEFMAFVANSFVFLLLGLSEDFLIRDAHHIVQHYPTLLVVIGTVLLARFLVVYLLYR